MKVPPDIEKKLKRAKALKISLDEILQPPQHAIEQINSTSGDYSPIATLGNFSLVTGKAKSRKSFYMGIAVSAASSNELILGRYKGTLPEEKRDVLYFDTEQGKYHVQQSSKRISRITQKAKIKNLYVYYLRALEPKERLEIIEAVIYANNKIGFVVIDGIRDLVTSINDEEQATMIASKLLKWTEERNIHISVVLHQNKGNEYARGHLGTELINKAELVLSVTKQNGNEAISIVKAEYSRDIEPGLFAFTIVDGLPTAVDDFVENTPISNRKTKLADIKTEDKLKLLRDVFSVTKDFRYKELVNQIKESYRKLFKVHVGDNQIKEFITECNSRNWINQEKPKSKYTLTSSLESP
ncbi:AAA family ATPase [Aestuariibaculum suncheonense]|uniref:AAA family ATPase n=1 Tax=Aestuariibaculum suncheonense TaxID=1028745 RepID=A0A8J6Q4W5_9FLAO|nr:AAA family ATPase [Aestuariibaculum suncheonense]MBD0834457.1 AAA family ATPase [Aestuariibaculum suncheonense]